MIEIIEIIAFVLLALFASYQYYKIRDLKKSNKINIGAIERLEYQKKLLQKELDDLRFKVITAE